MRIASLWRNWFRRHDADRALAEELDAYVALLTAEKIAAGIPDGDARRLARAEAGTAGTTEAVRDARRGARVDALIREIIQAARTLRRTPRFTVAAVVTLAIGLGAATAIFNLVNAALLRPLPFPHADRLAVLTEFHPRKAGRTGAPYPDLLEWERQNTVFAGMEAYWNIGVDGVVFGASGAPERLHYPIVTGGFFSLLGIAPSIGRSFTASDNIPGAGKVFIASDALWRRALSARHDAIGRTFVVDGSPYTLIGVLPPRLQFPDDCDIWFPLGVLNGFPTDRISHQFWVVGQLKDGVSIDRAQEEMSAIEHRLALAYPGTDDGWQVSVRSLRSEYIGNLRTTLLVLFGATGFILLIACASVANLTLARALGREREFGIRTALGASRTRLMMHCLVESGIVTAAGLAGGLLIAVVTRQVLFATTPLGSSRAITDRLDLRVWAFGAIVAAIVAAVIGAVPALNAIRRAPQDALRGGERTGTGRPARRAQNALVITELALTILLLSGAGLMARTLIALNRIDPGFAPDHLLTAQIALPDDAYPRAARRIAFHRELEARVGALPGVQSATIAEEVPFGGSAAFAGSFNVDDEPRGDWATARAAMDHAVSSSFFATLRIPLIRGRLPVASDSNVTVINRAMAAAFWPGGDPLGHRLMTLGDPNRPLLIIGIVGDVHTAGVDRAADPAMYVPGVTGRHVALAIRTTGDPLAVAREVRHIVATLDAGVAVYRFASMDQLIDASLGPRRLGLVLLASFAGFAVLVAAIGVFGLLTFTVSRRTREIGVRTALGARPRDILRSVGADGLALLGAGIMLGLIGAIVLTRFMRSLLFGVVPLDAATLGGAAITVAFVAVIAAYFPIRRALQVDPLTALRAE
ncbi:MAG: ADOP family duplicated permease [Gemmatimonadales bacterium]